MGHPGPQHQVLGGGRLRLQDSGGRRLDLVLQLDRSQSPGAFRGHRWTPTCHRTPNWPPAPGPRRQPSPPLRSRLSPACPRAPTLPNPQPWLHPEARQSLGPPLPPAPGPRRRPPPSSRSRRSPTCPRTPTRPMPIPWRHTPACPFSGPLRPPELGPLQRPSPSSRSRWALTCPRTITRPQNQVLGGDCFRLYKPGGRRLVLGLQLDRIPSPGADRRLARLLDHSGHQRLVFGDCRLRLCDLSDRRLVLGLQPGPQHRGPGGRHLRLHDP